MKLRTLRKFAGYYLPHKKLFIADIFCSLIISICNLFYPLVTKSIINDYVPNQNLALVLTWCGVLGVIYILRAFLNYFIQYWGHVLGVRIQGDMRLDMFRQLQKLPYSYFDSNRTGSIMSRLVNDLFDVSELAHHGPENILLSTITIVGTLIMLSFINIWLTLLVFCVLPIIIIFGSRTQKAMRKSFKEMREEVSKVNANVETSISGIRTTKAYGTEDYAKTKFEKVNKSFMRARGSAYRAMGIYYSGMGLIEDFLYLIILLAGGLFFFFSYIDVGELAAFILYVVTLLTPIKSLTTIYEQIQSGMSGFIRFCEVMDEKTEEDLAEAIELTQINEITFKDVTFAYENKNSALDNVSFELKKGESKALVGGSGGGKTTICHLLMQFYDADSGEIRINGIDIRNYKKSSLRSNIGIVAQDVFIFDGSVAENIRFGKIEASEEEIIAAAKQARIHEYVMSLEKGYQTWVGERGVKLSGGQRQRISIARAFLKNPQLLILDEATSALDNITEKQIQEALYDLSKGRTVLTVAHRLSTVRYADSIIVLNEGRVVEEGSHDELIKKEGKYAEMLKE